MKSKTRKRSKPAKTAPKAKQAKAASSDVEARRAAARERYAALKRDPKAYEAMLVKARERAVAFHARQQAEAEGARSGAKSRR